MVKFIVKNYYGPFAKTFPGFFRINAFHQYFPDQKYEIQGLSMIRTNHKKVPTHNKTFDLTLCHIEAPS